MKIRIKGDSLRYRLTRSDINTLYQTGLLEERTAFPGRELIYSIKQTSEAELTASFNNNEISLQMPSAMIKALAETDIVGFSDKGGPVLLLIEKDFTCLDNVEEDQSDNYPNPLLQVSNK